MSTQPLDLFKGPGYNAGVASLVMGSIIENWACWVSVIRYNHCEGVRFTRAYKEVHREASGNGTSWMDGWMDGWMDTEIDR